MHLNITYPEYWPDRIFIKMKDLQGVQLETYESKAARVQIAAKGKVNATLRRFESSRVTELPRSAKLASFKNTYEVVVDKPEQLNQLLSELNAMPEVAYAERVPLYYTSAVPNDPFYASGQQYAINKINATGAAGIHTGTAKTLLAIVDDAVLISHPDLQSNVEANRSYDVADKDNDPRPPAAGTNKATAYEFSHGTHCAGIAGAVTNNSVGVSSVSNNKVSIIGIKCTSDQTADSRMIERSAEGMVHAINQGARVISMSFGGTGTSQTIQNIINEATANGVVFVAAAGNENIETKHYPAAYDNVIAVASTDSKDLKSSFSNFGTWIDVSAPGSAILSTVANGAAGEYVSYNGTSMATPMVAGLVALMLSENPNLTPQAVTQILKSTADPVDNITGQSATYAGKLGTGRINAYKAIQAIQALTPGVAPSAITSLKINRTGKTDVDLAWTAPAINTTDPAVLYDIRYATAPITAANFGAATRTVKNITPGTPGTAQAVTISGLNPGTTYYFAIVARSLYGDGAPLSNVVNTTTLAAPDIAVSAGIVSSFNINRSNGTTASGAFTVTNSGTEPLTYSLNLYPRTGTNILHHDRLNGNADNKFGYGSASFMVATRFVAGIRGFNLSHVQNYFYNTSTVNNAAVGVRILKGGTTPANATLLASQSFTTTIPAGGDLLTFKLQQAHQLQPGEVFWVVFVIPAGLSSPQGIDTGMGARPGTFFLSSDGGSSYSDAQPLAGFLNTAAFKTRAVDANWMTTTPATGTIPAGQAKEVTMHVDAAGVVNGTYQADILFSSNAPLTPVVSRPITVNVTGGQGTMAVENAAVTFGTLFTGTSSTAKVVVKNTGVASLNVTAATFNGGEFPAADFALAPALPLTILPGSQQELSVTFTPSKKATLAGTLTLASDAASTPSADVSLSATLISPPVAVVTATGMDVVLNKTVDTVATRTITIANAGEAPLTYAVRVKPDPASTMAHDADRDADSFIGFGTTTVPLHLAVKFKVTTPRYTLAQVQTYFRSMAAAPHEATLKIYKGGTTPAEGTLLLQQQVKDAASANGGGMVTAPLQQLQQFVQGDTVWVVFVHTGVTSPQGVNALTPPDSTNFYSSDGSTWSAWSVNSFKIRALGTPTWLSVAASSGTIAPAGEASVDITVSATGLEAGNYTGSLEVVSNAMIPREVIQVNLQVQNSPAINPTALLRDREALDGVSVYPNPASGRFMLEFMVQKAEDLQIRMLSLSGHVVFEENYRNYSGSFKQQVETHRFAAGVYVLQVLQGDKLFTRKLIIR